jgi:Holliday junction resolvase RusA-like endonuclease
MGDVVMAKADLDLSRARQRLRALVGETVSEACAFIHSGNPIPKARARYGAGGHVFTPQRTRLAEGELVRAFREAWRRQPPLEASIALVVLFFVETRQRKDLDNLEKLVMDAATKARVWVDDSQVRAKTVLLELDRDRPRTVVMLATRVDSMSKAPLLDVQP